jgi:hypothetical protein
MTGHRSFGGQPGATTSVPNGSDMDEAHAVLKPENLVGEPLQLALL